MTPASIKISFLIVAGLIAILGLGYLLLASELAGVRRELAELRSETTGDMDGLYDLAKRLERGQELQAKQISGLQTWCNNIDRREDEQRAPRIRPQPGLTPTGGPTKLQLAVEEACRLRPADPATYVATQYPKRPDEV